MNLLSARAQFVAALCDDFTWSGGDRVVVFFFDGLPPITVDEYAIRCGNLEGFPAAGWTAEQYSHYGDIDTLPPHAPRGSVVLSRPHGTDRQLQFKFPLTPKDLPGLVGNHRSSAAFIAGCRATKAYVNGPM